MSAAEQQPDWQQVLDSYQQTTSQLEMLLLASDARERLDVLEQKMSQRAELLALLQQMPSEVLKQPEFQQKLLSIQTIDDRVEQGFRVVRQELQTKMNALQQQKNGLNGYRPYSGGAAAFIDSRK